MSGPIFIVGPHRGGSTLWHNLIAMAPGILRLPEPRFLGRPRQRDFRFFIRTQIGSLTDDRNVERMVKLCLSRQDLPGLGGAMWKFKGIEAADDPRLLQALARRIKDSNRTIESIVRILLEELTRFSGCSRACVKFPVEVRHIPTLIRWFPDCRIVHITRDPRALSMSKSNDPSGTASRVAAHPRLAWAIRKAALAMVIAQYRQSARIHQRCKRLDNYRLFRYEDLLADPRKTLVELCDFIQTDFIEEMLEPQRGRHEHQPSSLTGRQQKSFDSEAAVRWRRVIPAFDKAIILALTRRSMEQLGYSADLHPIFRIAKELQAS
ncbi:MAG: sulfotransferase [Burkholderiaceae bacterium]|nr:sulfotransferase [Burkholderiaceae bacterium]